MAAGSQRCHLPEEESMVAEKSQQHTVAESLGREPFLQMKISLFIKVKIVLIFKNMKKIVLLSIEVIGSKIDNQFLRFWLC